MDSFSQAKAEGRLDEWLDGRYERYAEACRTGEYVDEFSTPIDLVTPEQRVAAAKTMLRRLPKCCQKPPAAPDATESKK